MKNETEKWVLVQDYPEYEVSSLGTIKRISTQKIMTPLNNGNNYWGISLCRLGKKRRLYVHRIIASSFLPNPERKEEVNHIDGNRGNNILSNLEWVTRSENHHHRYQVLKQHGVNKGKKGALNWSSKPVLMMDESGNIIKEFPGVMEAARILGINESSIRSCIYGKSKTCKGYKWKYKDETT